MMTASFREIFQRMQVEGGFSMGLSTESSIHFAEKLATKLATALESPIAIAQAPSMADSSRLEVLRVVGSSANAAKSLQTELARAEFRWNDLADKIFAVVESSHPAILAIDASESFDRSLGLFAFMPNAPRAMLEALLVAIRKLVETECAQGANAAHLADVQEESVADSFIEQITQDFEELTWLRQSHHFADLYSVNASSIEVARTCIASLAEVIQAENLLFLEAPQIPSETDRERLHVLAGPSLGISALQMDRWIAQLTEQGRTSPILVDQHRDEVHQHPFPTLSNCMLTIVAKGDRVYGWLIAANKLPSTASLSSSNDGEYELDDDRFGTFEAGLMTTAANILASQASNSELFAAQEELTKGLVSAIINAIDAKDCYTAGHSERVASFAHCVATRMGLPKRDCDRIHMAGLLHDVGKIGIPDSVLKKPGKLTDEEFAIIKTHPTIGHSILKHLANIEYVLPGVLLHHEAFDGSGYPEGRRGDEIPPMARILAVCDAFDAMTSTRPYRTAMPLEKAMSILQAESRKTWDAEIVDFFLECIADGEITPGQVASIAAMNRDCIRPNSSSNVALISSSPSTSLTGASI
jgi:HD-GYP domain-containing protein (c-di-GMP phosphodiesterase class II)